MLLSQNTYFYIMYPHEHTAVVITTPLSLISPELTVMYNPITVLQLCLSVFTFTGELCVCMFFFPVWCRFVRT